MKAELLSAWLGLSTAAAADSCNRNQLGWTAGGSRKDFQDEREAGSLMRWKS